jgi:hypothetical protein
MFRLLRRRKEVSDARVEPEVSGTAQPSGPFNQTDRPEASGPPRGSDARAETAGSQTDAASGKIDREAIVALNVKAICDGTRLVADKAKSDHLRDDAIDMALSLQNGSYREFAVDHVVRLCRSSGEFHVAKSLYEQVADPSLRARMLSACPELRLLLPLNTVYPKG